MAFKRRFEVRLAARLLLLLVSAGVAARSAATGEEPVTTMLAIVGAVLVTASMWAMVNEGNLERMRFIKALERADLGQSFRRDGRGAGFDRLGTAYAGAVERLRLERASAVGEVRYADALVDSAPTAMLVLGPGDEVHFVNKAARRLFGRREAATLEALTPLGRGLVEALRSLPPERSGSAHMILDGQPQRVALDATTVELPSGTRRVISVRAIQSEVDEAALAAQVDLVRVLTHEVMNSLTPVTSLAGSAMRLIDEAVEGPSPGIAKARRAVASLARRADELERFVESYKEFSSNPKLHPTRINLPEWLGELERLFSATPAARGVVVTWPRPASSWTIDADRGLMTQAVLNLLKNAGEAVADLPEAAVAITVERTDSNRLRIVVADNGSGLEPSTSGDVFLPFFTTKANGTGIGLSFARKVVLLHGGQIGFADGPGGRVEILVPLIDS